MQIGTNFYTIEGEYIDTLLNLFDCDSIVSTYLSFSDLIAQLTIIGSDIQAVAINGLSPYTYDIYGPTGLLSSVQNNGSILQFTPIMNGIYYLIVTDDLNCISDTSFVYVDFVSTSIIEQSNDVSLKEIVDVLGRKTIFKRNRLLFYIYDDGTVEKSIVLE